MVRLSTWFGKTPGLKEGQPQFVQVIVANRGPFVFVRLITPGSVGFPRYG